MANTPIGISFMPSAENSELGPQQGAVENPSSDLAQAFKILSLHLPRNLSPHAIASQSLLNGQTSRVGAPGANPFSQAFEAMIRAMLGGQNGYMPSSAGPSYTLPGAPMTGPSRPSSPPAPRVPSPRITPGSGGQPEAPTTPGAAINDGSSTVPTPTASSSIPERPMFGGGQGNRRTRDGFAY